MFHNIWSHQRIPPRFFLPLVDVSLVVLSSVFSYFLRFGTITLHDRYVLATTVIALLVVIVNSSLGEYNKWKMFKGWTSTGHLILVFFVAGVITSSIIFFADASVRYSRLWIGYTLTSSFILILVFRLLIHNVLKKARLQGKVRRSVFLIGPGENLLEVARGMRATPGEGFSIAGVERISSIPENDCLDRISRRIYKGRVDEVWICVPLEMGAVVRSILYRLRNHTSDVRFVPSFRDMHLLNHRMSEVAGRAVIDLSVTPMNGVSSISKRVEDLLIGFSIFICIIPVCVVISVLVKLSSPGPILFKQYRTGVNGESFKVYKFRTMKIHEEETGVLTQAGRSDPRVTRIGRFLRKTSLDELPQFYNVLQGRMSIVGPRPHALEHNEHYKELVESYMRRHKVKPGITGWAQVNGFRGETETVSKMEARVQYDLWYIDNWNVCLDIKIILLTMVKGFFGKNAY
ncbi:undecaprenyl-phosphate glucose phosphotransferase [Halomonas sp. EF61]|uniref:undecaprenyl-phosphate glucose phosphotransferase n=1 Tax=Halomonas sp. EF61 TaxID=2950869 RepID=UPI0032DFD32C